MSTFLLLTLSRLLGGPGFWWTESLAARLEQVAVERDSAVAVAHARSAVPAQECGLQTGMRVDTHDGISNGF
jgi:hypothetical protein